MTETQTGFDAAIRKAGLKYGIYLGLLVLTLSIFSFYFITEIVTAPMLIIGGSVFFTYLAPFIFAVFFAFMIRGSVPLVPTYRQLVTGVFIMVITSYAISTIGYEFVFAKAIEPHMALKMEVAMEKSERIVYTSQGLNKGQAEIKIAEKKKLFDEQNHATIGQIIAHYAIYVILLFAASLIIALMVKGAART